MVAAFFLPERATYRPNMGFQLSAGIQDSVLQHKSGDWQ